MGKLIQCSYAQMAKMGSTGRAVRWAFDLPSVKMPCGNEEIFCSRYVPDTELFEDMLWISATRKRIETTRDWMVEQRREQRQKLQYDYRQYIGAL